MLSDMYETKDTSILSQENTSASEEPKTSSPYTRRTQEEGRALVARNRAILVQIRQYMEDNNLLPTPCPAPKVR
jgi:hypothetical protein